MNLTGCVDKVKANVDKSQAMVFERGQESRLLILGSHGEFGLRA